MLVITRKCNEEITIGTGVQVRVLSIRGSRVQLGIEAPQDIRIHRAELFAEDAVQHNDAGTTRRQRDASQPLGFDIPLRSAS